MDLTRLDGLFWVLVDIYGYWQFFKGPDWSLWVLLDHYSYYGSWWILWVPDGYLWIFVGPNELLHSPDGSSRVLMDSYRSQWILWVLMDYYGLWWICMGPEGFLRVQMGPDGSLWFIIHSTGPDGSCWFLMDSYGYFWVLMNYFIVLMDPEVSWRIPLDSYVFQWILLFLMDPYGSWWIFMVPNRIQMRPNPHCTLCTVCTVWW